MRPWITLSLLLALAPPAGARSLYWAALEVEAELEADGRLHVVERQAMVFTGDWNGGERVFRVSPGQSLELHAMRRIDPQTGRARELRRGSLGTVDNYDWHGRDTLRWRSRDPGDPPFDSTTIVYELDYTLSGVVSQQGARYRLDHDFAFPDRVGPIGRFTLDLLIDPAWETRPVPGAELEATPAGQRVRLERANLPPGRSVVLGLDLARIAGEAAAAVRRQLGQEVRLGIALAAAAVLLLLVLRFFAFERRQGRFAPAAVPEAPDSGWLEEHLLSLRPEEAGALWDQSIGPPEVAAVLARLVAEGKLASSVREEGKWIKRQVLELELRADRDAFEGYERRLIDKLFFGGRDRTDTEAVRKRYRSTGFSPVATISPGLDKRLRKQPGFGKKLRKPSIALSGLALLAAVGCFVVEGLTRGGDAVGPALGMVVMTMIPPLLFGYLFAAIYRKRADRLAVLVPFFLLPIAAGAAVLLNGIRAGADFSLPGLGDVGLVGTLGMVLVAIAFLNSVLNMARTRDGAEAVAARRRLAAVRRWLARELDRREPALTDSWLPYLLAFGLQRHMDRWARSYAVANPTRDLVTTGGSSSPARGWSGGGGAFGGAGATAGWAAAAGSLAAGVSPPGSSGSGGGGGGGGGSSGGGGGGGW